MICKILIGGETGVKPGNKPAGLKAAATMTNQMRHQNNKNISAKR
jgi:hypothetical protein